MNRRVACAAAVLSLAATGVSAQTAGFYSVVPSTAGYSSDQSAQSPAPAQNGSALGQSASVGYDFGGGFRTEVENFQTNAGPDPVTGSERNSSSVMLTGIYDIPTGKALKPYVGAGFGAIAKREGIPGVTPEQWTNGYQFRGGLSYEVSNAMKGLLEYRLQGSSGPSTKFEVKSKGVVVGLKYLLR
jgi:opacity protein-like surface antigen